LCDMPGHCEVQTELVKNTSTFEGKRSSFEYEHVSEQKWNRKQCCIAIPEYKVHTHVTYCRIWELIRDLQFGPLFGS
jgi:hypothetical protein